MSLLKRNRKGPDLVNKGQTIIQEGGSGSRCDGVRRVKVSTLQQLRRGSVCDFGHRATNSAAGGAGKCGAGQGSP